MLEDAVEPAGDCFCSTVGYGAAEDVLRVVNSYDVPATQRLRPHDILVQVDPGVCLPPCPYHASKDARAIEQVHAASINPLDVDMRRGYLRKLLETGRNPPLPFVLGRDFSGEVPHALGTSWHAPL